MRKIYFTLALALSALVMGGVFVWLQTQQIVYGYRITKLQNTYQEAIDLHRKLELSWNYLCSPLVLEKLAHSKLRMRPPAPEQVIILSR